MRHQQQITALLLIILYLFVAGCTQAITGTWKKPAYGESINKFLTTNDGKKLIFIGDKYHYIFSNHDALTDILQWKDRSILDAEFDKNFTLDQSNSISGSYIITCKCLNASIEQIQWLKDNKFIKSINSDHATYTLRGSVNGKRYLSNDLNLDRYKTLNNEYKITIEEEFTSLETLQRVALTPIAIAADGVATIGVAYLLVISIPFNIADAVMD